MYKQCRPGRCVRHGSKDKRCGTEGCTSTAKGEEFVCGMEQRRNYAASRDAQINLRSAQEAQGKDSPKLCSIEGCTNKARKGGLCMRHGAKVQLCRRNDAALRNAQSQIKLRLVLCVLGMWQRANCDALKDA
eukprot:scaffold457_cov117-Skeletonema_dohrnii-CCMP3373.AAC.1